MQVEIIDRFMITYSILITYNVCIDNLLVWCYFQLINKLAEKLVIFYRYVEYSS